MNSHVRVLLCWWWWWDGGRLCVCACVFCCVYWGEEESVSMRACVCVGGLRIMNNFCYTINTNTDIHDNDNYTQYHNGTNNNMDNKPKLKPSNNRSLRFMFNR